MAPKIPVDKIMTAKYSSGMIQSANELSDELRDFFSKNGKKGGIARRDSLTKERIKEIASIAGKANKGIKKKKKLTPK